MGNDAPAGSLPTELISNKTFYTLGGASAAVFLTCWVINYVSFDASWLNYRTYRLIALILSEICAIIIMYKNRKKESINWIFGFLNGLLIFVNASGLNVMTSTYIFNPKDSAAKKENAAYHHLQNDKMLEAAIIPLPRMISWWPDEKLLSINQELSHENTKLTEENHELRTILDKGTEGSKSLLAQKDSLILVINSMLARIDEKQKQIDQLTEAIKGGNDRLSSQLVECQKNRNELNDNLLACQLSTRQLKATNDELKNQIGQLNEKLRNCVGKNPSLAELLQLVCNKNSKPESRDNKLRQQSFYKKIAWTEFCRSFNGWYNQVE